MKKIKSFIKKILRFKKRSLVFGDEEPGSIHKNNEKPARTRIWKRAGRSNLTRRR